jgi:3-isopropylmalate dehydratase small subunit
MIHFLYLFGFAVFVGVAFGVFASGSSREKIVYGLKIFGQFLVISLVLAWLFYFLPW